MSADNKIDETNISDIIARVACPVVKPWIDGPEVPRRDACDCKGRYDDPDWGWWWCRGSR